MLRVWVNFFCFSRVQPKPEDTSNNYRSMTSDWKMSLSRSPLQNDDINKYRLENNQLRLQVKQLNLDLQSEQGQ